ncbi:MAG: hypothetical protein WAQ27_04930, partial [Candidatus Microsaccharimonas sp.]
MTNYERIEQFAKPFDPGMDHLPDEEKEKAAEGFIHLADDLLLANLAEATRSEDGSTISYRTEHIQRGENGRYASHLEIYERNNTVSRV